MNWAQLHAATFGGRTAEWAETYRVWHRLWTLEGFSDEELLAAVRAVARRKSPPNFVNQHFAAMGEELREARIKLLNKNVSKKENNRGVCLLCKDTGHIVVPHRNSWLNGRWTRNIPPNQGYTMAVICHNCNIGKHRNLRGQLLAEYECEFPDWRLEMRTWEEIQKQRGAVEGHHRFRIDRYDLEIKRKGDRNERFL